MNHNDDHNCQPSSLRLDPIYIKLYLLCTNLAVNGIIPATLLIALNLLTFLQVLDFKKVFNIINIINITIVIIAITVIKLYLLLPIY